MNSDDNDGRSSKRIIFWSFVAATILLSSAWCLLNDGEIGGFVAIVAPIVVCVLVFVRTVLQWFGLLQTGDEWQDWRNEPVDGDGPHANANPNHSNRLDVRKPWPRKRRFSERFRKSLKARVRWASDRHYNRND